jgi:hypothetical protein
MFPLNTAISWGLNRSKHTMFRLTLEIVDMAMDQTLQLPFSHMEHPKNPIRWRFKRPRHWHIG